MASSFVIARSVFYDEATQSLTLLFMKSHSYSGSERSDFVVASVITFYSKRKSKRKRKVKA